MGWYILCGTGDVERVIAVAMADSSPLFLHMVKNKPDSVSRTENIHSQKTTCIGSCRC